MNVNDWVIPLVKAAFIGETSLAPSSKGVGVKGQTYIKLEIKSKSLW
jgi:hypothetical protein